MILVDTSIWIDHLHQPDETLAALLEGFEVAVHPMVIGELAMGGLANRRAVLTALGGLPALPNPTVDEVMDMIEVRTLYGRGLGLVDVYLLAAALLLPGTRIWTRDKQLADTAKSLHLSFQPV